MRRCLGTLALITVVGMSCDEEPAGPTTGPAKLVMVLGDHQDGKVGQRLGVPFLVQVIDAQGAGVAGVTVAWTVTSGDGALEGAWEECSSSGDELGNPVAAESVSTNSGGFASVSFVPAWFGPTTVTAVVDSLAGSPLVFTIDATDPGASLYVDYPFDQEEAVEVIAGPQLQRGRDLLMWITDGLGNGAPGVAVNWEIVSGGGELREVSGCSSAVTTSPTTIMTRTNHQWGGSYVSFRATAFGITTVTATVAGVPGPPGTFTLDATLFEIVVRENQHGVPLLEGPDHTADATVPVGAVVEWWNFIDSARIRSISQPPGGDPFDSGPLSDGARFRFVPPIPGTWVYEDEVSGVTGTLTAVSE